MANHDYSLAGLISLDAGSWADWFSGTMSFAAVVAALFGYWVVHRQRTNDVREQEKRAAESVGWKVLKVYNDTATIAKHLRISLGAEQDLDFNSKKFARVRPLGIPAKSTSDLNQEEIGILLKAKATDVLMELSDAIARYDSIRFAMQEYKSRHEALYDLMPAPVAVQEGALFTHRLNREQYERVMPYTVMLETLLDGLIVLVAEGVSKADWLLTAYGTSMRTYFGKWHLDFVGNKEEADLDVFRSCPLGK